MAFRRFRRGFRRRRQRPETYTVVQCRTCLNIVGDKTCSNPLVDVLALITQGSTRTNPPAGLLLTSGSDRFLTVKGISFQAEHLMDPSTALGGTNQTPQPFDVVAIVTIWEAIMVLPLFRGTLGTPDYVPLLTDPTTQGADMADRVLWKRVTHLPFWGTNTVGGIGIQLVTTGWQNPGSSGPQRVKSRARLDDKHGVFYVRNIVHDVIFDVQPANPLCTGVGGVAGQWPLVLDAMFKIYYNVR